jgi:DNA primase
MIFSENLIKEIKDRVSIVSIAQEYIGNIKRSGKNWIALCPFHGDKNPSLYFSDERGFYKCFACGEKGDVITLIQRLDNLSFQESVLFLAKKAGVDIVDDGSLDSEDYKLKSTLIEFNKIGRAHV